MSMGIHTVRLYTIPVKVYMQQKMKKIFEIRKEISPPPELVKTFFISKSALKVPKIFKDARQIRLF